MFKRILVPVDPSRSFGPANEYACALAQRFQANIIATYVIDEQLIGGHVSDQAAGALDDALEWVGRDAMDDYAKHHPEVPINKTLIYGPTHTAIFQMVLQTGADVVVIGGYHSLSKPHLWGSTVLDIVHHDERPTFVVREASRIPGKGEKIVVPFDGSDRPLENLGRIAKLADQLGTSVELVHVASKRHADRADHILTKGKRVLEGHGVKVEGTHINSRFWKPKGKQILEHARKVRSPLIAVSRLGRTSIHTGRSNTVAWLVTHSEVPVWVVRK